MNEAKTMTVRCDSCGERSPIDVHDGAKQPACVGV
jgi:hypothetical protein